MPGRAKSSYPSIYFVYDTLTENVAREILDVTLLQFDQYVNDQYLRCVSTEGVIEAIHAARQTNGMIFHFLSDPDLRQRARTAAANYRVHVVDLLAYPVDGLSEWFDKRPIHGDHQYDEKYFRLLDAMKFRRLHDDGQHPEGWINADIILLGISRSLKTPISLMLTEEGFFVVNVPVTLETSLPSILNSKDLTDHIYVLKPNAIEVKRAREVRDLGDSQDNANYASPTRIRRELELLDQILKEHGNWTPIDVSRRNPEEAVKHLKDIHLERFPEGRKG